jgi:predicted ATP-grasp superfamily ATP-dependent carboligase
LRRSNSGKGIRKVYRPEELLEAYHQIMKMATFPPIIQEFIQGEDYYEVDVFYNHGKEVAFFCRKNIRFKSRDGGSASKALSIEAPEMLAATRKIFSHLQWHGVASCEFAFCPRTQTAYLFEINPRYWGTLPFDIDCGVEFPWYHYLVATSQEIGHLPDYPLGKQSIWILGDIIGFLEHFSPSNKLLSQLRDYTPFNVDYYMDFKKEDLRPFLQQAWYYLEKFLKTGSRNPIDEGMIG